MTQWRHYLPDSQGTADFLNLMKIKQKAFLDKMTSCIRNGTVLVSLTPSVSRVARQGKVSTFALAVFRSSPLSQIRQVQIRLQEKSACLAMIAWETTQLLKGGQGTSLMMLALQESQYTTSNPIDSKPDSQ